MWTCFCNVYHGRGSQVSSPWPSCRSLLERGERWAVSVIEWPLYAVRVPVVEHTYRIVQNMRMRSVDQRLPDLELCLSICSVRGSFFGISVCCCVICQMSSEDASSGSGPFRSYLVCLQLFTELTMISSCDSRIESHPNAVLGQRECEVTCVSGCCKGRISPDELLEVTTE
jgi:hypothetical protein